MTGEHAPREDRDAAPTERESAPATHATAESGVAAGIQPANPTPPPASPSVAASNPAARTVVGALPAASAASKSAQADFVAVRHPDANSFASPLALLLDTDLFFAVKVADTLKHVGYTTKTLRRPEDFAAALVAEQPTLALVNTGARGLDWRSGVAAAVAAGVPVVAFGSHVDLATQQEARDLGATSVIANSKLAADLPGVVARALKRSHPRQE